MCGIEWDVFYIEWHRCSKFGIVAEVLGGVAACLHKRDGGFMLCAYKRLACHCYMVVRVVGVHE
jgi:hypothetical protein